MVAQAASPRQCSTQLFRNINLTSLQATESFSPPLDRLNLASKDNHDGLKYTNTQERAPLSLHWYHLLFYYLCTHLNTIS